MASIYSQIYIQVILAVEGEANLIQRTWQNGLYDYIRGFITNRGQKVLAINGAKDHVHLLLVIKSNIALIDLIRDVQLASSRYVNQNQWVTAENFTWQDGFGAFSYSRSHLDTVIDYINNQPLIHEKISFQHEYLTLLKKFEIAYVEADLFTWIEEKKEAKKETPVQGVMQSAMNERTQSPINELNAESKPPWMTSQNLNLDK